MPIEFHCFLCGQRLRVADGHQGQRARCPRCDTIVDVPDVGEPAEPILLGTVRSKADVIDYELFGSESQFVEITLDPGEIAIAEAETLFYMSPGIEMEIIAGDVVPPTGGLLERLAFAGNRILSGESLSMVAFCNMATQREIVAFAPVVPGKLIPMHLDELGGELVCQRNALVCVARGIEISTVHDEAAHDGLALHRILGDGIVILHAGGTLVHRTMKPTQKLHVGTDSIVAMTSEIRYELQGVGGVQGEKMFVTTLMGPGEIWLQTRKRVTSQE